MKQAAADVAEQAAPVAEEAKRRGAAAAAALAGEPEKKSGKKKWFLLAALAGGAAFLAKKLGGEQGVVELAVVVHPGAEPVHAPCSREPVGSHGRHSPTTPADTAGANPSESIADSVEEPHPVTTPDAPAEEVEIADAAAETAEPAESDGAAKKKS